MAKRVDLNGVDTWYDERGTGEPLVLLHGGLVGANAFEAMAPHLEDRFRLYVPERRGHGHTPDQPGPITFDLMADDTITFIETVVGGPVFLAGHSDGGILTLLIAQRRPDLVRKAVPISASMHHDVVLGLSDMSVENVVEWMGDDYAATSPDGRDHLPKFAAKVLRMWREEPELHPSDLTDISVPTLIMAADDDAITFEHTTGLFEAIPGAQLAIVPGTSHALIDEKPALVAQLLADFLTNDPIETRIPVRRRKD
ncbi:MAG TPA: alpha/beta hydrolase [Thermomicrobiales bacterium]|jgi:pimeloyl-ACP methyl ester carboxylesterase|nr:alpha/beta hydrolase [Thermomicrobiales bacterium]